MISREYLKTAHFIQTKYIDKGKVHPTTGHEGTQVE
jgi:hypothetical protein